MESLFGLSHDEISRLHGVFRRYPEIERVVIYGSRAKGNYRAGSDIDLTLYGEMDWVAFNRLSVELDDLLLPYQIDLSLYGQLDSNEMKEHIRRAGKDFYIRPEKNVQVLESDS